MADRRPVFRNNPRVTVFGKGSADQPTAFIMYIIGMIAIEPTKPPIAPRTTGFEMLTKRRICTLLKRLALYHPLLQGNVESGCRNRARQEPDQGRKSSQSLSFGIPILTALAFPAPTTPPNQSSAP